jgi:O-antigen/teichoic acid export membrane protein
MLLTAGLLPYFAENFGRGAVGEMREAYATATRVLAFVVLPTCFGLAALLPILLPMMYGRAFADAVPAATVVVLASGVGAIAFVGTTLVMAMDRSDFVFFSGLACAVLAIVTGFTVIPAFGVMGAAWSRAAIQIAAVAMGCWRLRSAQSRRAFAWR